ncbi:PREDICTED: ATP-dependent RNA helicase mss116, mitochondrial-like [Nestor notabilis]|uniref:ATP-dependent RNA helicase mss116, mitochondrial-like n=1 Tax=Nestor notabilis TaxID=176057 RepID=UPI000523A5CB|nr:PREDICTED: ATP-dependent RNA helicase mss116, mitochondrial-like [Nestor notabilis]
MALGDYMGASCHACIGGTNVRAEVQKLQMEAPHIIVGTPGRVFDMLNRRYLYPPKTAPNGPQRPQNPPKVASKRPQPPQKRSKTASTGPQMGPQLPPPVLPKSRVHPM